MRISSQIKSSPVNSFSWLEWVQNVGWWLFTTVALLWLMGLLEMSLPWLVWAISVFVVASFGWVRTWWWLILWGPYFDSYFSWWPEYWLWGSIWVILIWAWVWQVWWSEPQRLSGRVFLVTSYYASLLLAQLAMVWLWPESWWTQYLWFEWSVWLVSMALVVLASWTWYIFFDTDKRLHV